MSHTRHLSLMEDLAFRRLLDFYYLHEQPIKQRDIARQIGMREYEQDVLTVLNEFFVSGDDGFLSPRADKEIMEFKQHQAKSAWGAFARDNKVIAGKADKELFLVKFLSGEHRDYIATLVEDHLCMMGTSSTDDATNTQEPVPYNHKPIKEKATVVATPVGVSQSVWEDFVKHRKAKKAQVTQTVIDGIAREAQKAGWSLDDALREVVVRNWQSFKASWVVEKMTAAEQRLNTMHQLTGGISTPKTGNFWDKPKTNVIEAENVECKRLL